MPRVSSASVPSYPPILHQAHIAGVVTLRVTTDGKRVVKFETESGPAALVKAAEENVGTWEFEQHTARTFDVRFEYKLSPAPPCGVDFDPWDPKYMSERLQLPMTVELTWVMPRTCDPSAMIEGGK